MALTLTHRALINERKARMRRNGDRPHGGIHEAAIEQIAREQGLSVAALKWRLRQYYESQSAEFLSAVEERNKEARLILVCQESNELRCYKAVFPVAFRAEVLGVLIAVLPVGVFAASTMNSGRWFSIELASPVATAASETGRGQTHYGSHASIAEEQEREPEPNSGIADPPFSRN